MEGALPFSHQSSVYMYQISVSLASIMLECLTFQIVIWVAEFRFIFF